MELAAVVLGQVHGREAVGGVVAQVRQVLADGLEPLDLLGLLAVGDAGRLDVHEGEARVADGLLDDRGHARQVGGRGLGHEAGAVGQHVEQRVHRLLQAAVVARWR